MASQQEDGVAAAIIAALEGDDSAEDLIRLDEAISRDRLAPDSPPTAND